MAHSREMAPSISSRRPVAKSEPNRHPEILTLLLFEKYLLNSYYVKDTARLEDTLKAHVPVLKMFGDNCKNHFNSVQKSAKLEICTYYGLPRHHKFRRFGGQADSMLRISHSGSWRNQNMPVCWVHSVLFFFFLVENMEEGKQNTFMISGQLVCSLGYLSLHFTNLFHISRLKCIVTNAFSITI